MRRQVFVVWFIIFLVWALFRAYTNLPEWIDEYFVKPTIFVLPIVLVVLFREKKGVCTLGICPSPKDFITDLFLGVCVGIVFALEGLFSNYLKYGQFSFAPLTLVETAGGVLPFLVLNIVSAAWEEMLGRGYLFQRLYETSGILWKEAFLSSFLFFLLHIPIIFARLHLRGVPLLVYMLTTILLGVTNCYLLAWRKQLTLPILVHAFWNMTVALYL